ncbi:MAG: hypothetical protein LBR50_07145 [Tannerella sp.]|nr:hypothetical protein [Tannerella sp.]
MSADSAELPIIRLLDNTNRQTEAQSYRKFASVGVVADGFADSRFAVA